MITFVQLSMKVSIVDWYTLCISMLDLLTALTLTKDED